MPASKRRGFVHMWACLLVMGFIALLAVALDRGYAYLAGHQLQNAADASALAGCLKVRHAPSLVVNASTQAAFANHAAKTPVSIYPQDGDLTIGTWMDGEFTPGGTSPNAVRIVARRVEEVADKGVRLNFGTLFGMERVEMTRTAIAAIQDSGGGPALLVLHPSNPRALDVSGNSSLTVVGGPIHVNSNNAGQGAVWIGGNTTVSAPAINAAGTINVQSGASLDASLNPGSEALPDPLADLPAPQDFGPIRSQGSATTLHPGHYPGGIDVGTGVSITLNPGIYVLDASPNALRIRGTLYADGVMIYLKSGGLDIRSGAAIVLRPPDPDVHAFPGSATFEGVTLFQARNNTSAASVSLSGTMDFRGTFYFPNNRIVIAASGGQVSARILASELSFAGNGSIGITFPGYNDEDKSVYLVR